LADLVVVAHVCFVLFVAFGSILAWRWPLLCWLHVPLVGYCIAQTTIQFDCPLTRLELHLRRLADQQQYGGGFVRHYLTHILYAGSYMGLLRALAVLCITAGYAGVLLRGRRARQPLPTGT
jgi:hypothetical protein